MLQEYLKLTDIISGFDSSLITVKSWGVTLSLVAIGLGFKEKTWGYFLLAVISGIAFWTVEFTMKGHQMRYFPRMREIEYQMFQTDPTNAPRIDWSWTHADKIFLRQERAEDILAARPTLMNEYVNYVRYRRMFLSHIMFPHVLSIFFGGIFSWLGYRRIERFRDYGP